MLRATHIPYADTHSFSGLVTAYLGNVTSLQPFYHFKADETGINAAIESRTGFKTDRATLVNVLEKQYTDLPEMTAVQHNIRLLANEDTFTICTAHQPNLGTGYLYFTYKILHAVKLARDLKAQYPDKDFVPVYYIGSEDNDLEELGTFRYGGQKFVWDADGQTGAVGRMNTASLKPLLDELFAILGPPGVHLDNLKEILAAAYLQHDTIARATQYLVHRLFGSYGLIALNADDADLKQAFIPVMESDLLLHEANKIVADTAEALQKAGYTSQAYPRPINLFYLKDDIRERIETDGTTWKVVGKDIHWNREDLLKELNTHPERFSPNVILRGLYQETILPNIAFIGGGSEVAYWLQLQDVFKHYKVFYPVVLLRQSVLWINEREAALRKKTGLGLPDLFLPESDIIKRFVKEHTTKDCSTGMEQAGFEEILSDLRTKAAAITPTLRSSTDAVIAKIRYQLQVLEKKMLRAEKRNMSTRLDQISRLKAALFPNHSLQERVENFMPFYLQYGSTFFDDLLQAMQPFPAAFLVLEEEV